MEKFGVVIKWLVIALIIAWIILTIMHLFSTELITIPFIGWSFNIWHIIYVLMISIVALVVIISIAGVKIIRSE